MESKWGFGEFGRLGSMGLKWGILYMLGSIIYAIYGILSGEYVNFGTAAAVFLIGAYFVYRHNKRKKDK